MAHSMARPASRAIPILAETATAKAFRRDLSPRKRERKHETATFCLIDCPAFEFRGVGRTMKFLRVLPVVVLMHLSLAGPALAAGSGARAHPAVAKTDGPGLRSSSALVLDLTHSATLYSRNPDTPLPIASITKLMTSLVVADAGQPLDEVLEITKDNRSIGKGAYSRLGYGTKLTRGDLMHLALMSSENRAAHALGRNYPGGIPAFVRAMNRKAAALGMTHAHFVDPAGLSSENV